MPNCTIENPPGFVQDICTFLGYSSTTDDHGDCFVGMNDSDSNTECAGCGYGCAHFTQENSDNSGMHAQSDRRGCRFARSSQQPQNAVNRDARNALFDLRSNEPRLVKRGIAVERGSVWNPGDVDCGSPVECFGTDAGGVHYHVCRAFPCPSTFGPPETQTCPSGATWGQHVLGSCADTFHHIEGRFPATDIECRKFTEPLGSENRVMRPPYLDGMPAVILVGDQGGNSNHLARCQGRTQPQTACPNCGDVQWDPTEPGHEQWLNPNGPTRDCFNFAEVSWDSVAWRVLAGGSPIRAREAALANAVFAYMRTHTFLPAAPLGVKFDRLDHRHVTATQEEAGNFLLGYFAREWPLPTDPVVPIGDNTNVVPLPGPAGTNPWFPFARTRFGGCAVTAELVITKALFEVRVFPHTTSRENPDPPPIGIVEITPYAMARITVELGIRATLDEPCDIGGTPVTITPGAVSGRVPSVEPFGAQGNQVMVALEDGGWMQVPLTLRWQGKLDHFSSPAVPRIDQDRSNHFLLSPIGERCLDHARVLSQVSIPPLHDALDSDPDDRNKSYEGSVGLRFPGPGGFPCPGGGPAVCDCLTAWQPE